ncbi:MAG: hypothetical protein AABX73_02145 [Nanoarchaeota archaeon]
MNKWAELFVGLILIIIPIIIAWYSQSWGYLSIWRAAMIVFLGGIFWLVVMLGVLFILLGISDLKG